MPIEGLRDALGHRAKIGILVPATNTIVEPELAAMQPPGVTNQLFIVERRGIISYIPDLNAANPVRKATLDANAKLAEQLNSLSAALDDAAMARLNASVDVDKKAVEAVAAEFLKSHNLI